MLFYYLVSSFDDCSIYWLVQGQLSSRSLAAAAACLSPPFSVSLFSSLNGIASYECMYSLLSMYVVIYPNMMTKGVEAVNESDGVPVLTLCVIEESVEVTVTYKVISQRTMTKIA